MSGLRILAAAAALASALGVAAASAGMIDGTTKRAPCSVLTARDRILASPSLPKALKDAAGGANGGGVDRIICKDVTFDQRTDMTVLVTSGSSTGVTAWVVFRGRASSWQLVFSRLRVFHATVTWTRGDLVENQPARNGGVNHRRYHWERNRFVLLRVWHTAR